LYSRKLNLKAKLESGSSCFQFPTLKPGAFNTCFNLLQLAPTHLVLSLAGEADLERARVRRLALGVAAQVEFESKL